MTDKHIELLSERLRPQKLRDLTLRLFEIEKLERMVVSKSVMSMLFYGKAGTGKTSAARILMKEIDADVYELNGSHNHGDKAMVHGIENFANAVSLYLQPKIVFIDEADGLTKNVQASLRHLIERSSDRVRFLLTANDEQKLTAAMKSRCMPLCFDPPFGAVAEIVDRLVERYQMVLAEGGLQIDVVKIRQIVGSRFPDMRAIANALEFECL